MPTSSAASANPLQRKQRLEGTQVLRILRDLTFSRPSGRGGVGAKSRNAPSPVKQGAARSTDKVRPAQALEQQQQQQKQQQQKQQKNKQQQRQKTTKEERARIASKRREGHELKKLKLQRKEWKRLDSLQWETKADAVGDTATAAVSPASSASRAVMQAAIRESNAQLMAHRALAAAYGSPHVHGSSLAVASARRHDIDCAQFTEEQVEGRWLDARRQQQLEQQEQQHRRGLGGQNRQQEQQQQQQQQQQQTGGPFGRPFLGFTVEEAMQGGGFRQNLQRVWRAYLTKLHNKLQHRDQNQIFTGFFHKTNRAGIAAAQAARQQVVSEIYQENARVARMKEAKAAASTNSSKVNSLLAAHGVPQSKFAAQSAAARVAAANFNQKTATAGGGGGSTGVDTTLSEPAQGAVAGGGAAFDMQHAGVGEGEFGLVWSYLV